jgi:hypothetical protein
VQLTLALLDLPAPPATPGVQLDPEARAKAIEILARMIAQTLARLTLPPPKPAIRIPRCWHILMAIQDALREPLREASSAGYLIPRLTRANAVLGRS